ncbi:MAG: DUF1616 domain-containing protein, partial [Anaerolineae bacterium]
MFKNLAPPYRWWPLLLFVTANGLLFIPALPGLRYGAALMLLAFVPGWIWLQAIFPASPQNPPERTPLPLDALERAILATGLSLALTIIVTMFTVYLPGAISFTPFLLALDTLIALGVILLWRRERVKSPAEGAQSEARIPKGRKAAQVSSVTYPSQGIDTAPRFILPPSAFILLLLLLLFLAAVLRLPRLGYAEFHEDEAEALMLGVRLMQGEDYALFLHRKGPAQMLVPLAFWLLTGQISEAMARFPFALSSLLSVATLFVIGRRWFGMTAGFITALLWAVNGYAIAFGRMAQYQALIFFLGPLTLYCLYLARMEGWSVGRPVLS